MKKKDIIKLFFLILITISNGCTAPYYGTKYQQKNMKKFSVAKTNGIQRHFLKKQKKRLNPSYTKFVKDWHGD